jgi:L-threonylcarbamoyladenylate synthase
VERADQLDLPAGIKQHPRPASDYSNLPTRPQPLSDANPRPHVLSADSEDAIQQAAELIRNGRLVAFPTETVYGLGANALDGDAVRAIFAAKRRPAFNPLIVHVADASGIGAVVSRIPEMALDLAAAFWPGPLTLVLPRAANIPDAVSAGLESVAVRVPNHPVAQALIRAAGVPIAAPSANLYTHVSPTTAAHVVSELHGAVDLVLDGGPCDVGIESTVLDLCGPKPALLRPGGVSVTAIEHIVGAVQRPTTTATGTAARPSPGMSARHYAPRARLYAFAANERATVCAELSAAVANNTRCAMLAFDCAKAPAGALAIAMPTNPAGYAQRLFAALHQIDQQQCDFAVLEQIPVDQAWEAIRDRLRRAGLEPASSMQSQLGNR